MFKFNEKILISFLGIVAILFASLIGKEIGRVTGIAVSQSTTQLIEQKVIEGLEEAARQVNTTTPIIIDDETRLDKASVGPGARINYNYTLISYSSHDIDGNRFRQDFLPKVRSDICSNDKMKKALQYSGIYSYSYFGNDGVLIATFDVNNADCANDKIRSNI